MTKKTDKKSAPAVSRMARRRKFKHGAYATIFTVVFIAVIIVLNITATVLADRFPISTDLTANGDFTIDEENKDYIKAVEREVTITLCSKEDDYTGGTYSQYLAYNNISDQTGGKFFTQAVALLKDYQKLNSNIKVVFSDPQDPSFDVYTAKYSSESFTLGDILVECSFSLNGQQYNHYRHLTITDLYELDTTYASYGYTYLTGSNIETAVTSAIYSVTSDKTDKIAVVTANGGGSISGLEALMKQNNYEFVEVTSLLTEEIPSDASMVIVTAPTKDFNEEELQKLEDYLDMNGERGKNILYIADATQGNLPNINDFISEWGFTIGSGRVYETDSKNFYRYNTTPYLTDNGTDYTDAISNEDYILLSNSHAPITVKFEERESRSTKTILSIDETAVAQPLDAGDNWSAESASVKGPFVALGIAQDTSYDDDYNRHTSRVMVLSSLDFINTSYNNSYSCGNLEALMSSINVALGRESSTIKFDSRTYEKVSFTADSAKSSMIFIIFGGVIPVTVLVIGIIVWVRRKHL